MKRRIALGGIAVLIVVMTLVTAERKVSDPPSFELGFPVEVAGVDVMIEVQCNALRPGETERELDVADDSFRDGPNYSQVHESMSLEQLKAYAEQRRVKWKGATTDEEVEEREAFISRVTENTKWYCGQMRENRQTDLLMIYGGALLWLVLVGIAAVLTAPRSRSVESGQL